MKEETRLKLVLWLSGLQFVLSSLVVVTNAPTRIFVRDHGGPDVLIDGHATQHRRLDRSNFILHLWPIEMACASGMCGIIFFITLASVICCLGLSRLIRKIRIPEAVNARNDNPLSNQNDVILTTRKMIFFHPRVIICTCLLIALFFGVAACVTVHISYATSDHFDKKKLVHGQPLGTFSVETYICEILEYEFASAAEDMVVMYHRYCQLASAARWMTLFSTLCIIFHFFFCVWAFDAITQPVASQTDLGKARKLDARRKRSRENICFGKKQPGVERVAERF